MYYFANQIIKAKLDICVQTVLCYGGTTMQKEMSKNLFFLPYSFLYKDIVLIPHINKPQSIFKHSKHLHII
jgi:hypothetical protein